MEPPVNAGWRCSAFSSDREKSNFRPTHSRAVSPQTGHEPTSAYLRPVPQREAEHSVEPAESGFYAPDPDAFTNTSVSDVPTKSDHLPLKFSPKLQMVVDFTIEHNHLTPGVREHWLMTGRRQIKDRQPDKTQKDACSMISPTIRRRRVHDAATTRSSRRPNRSSSPEMSWIPAETSYAAHDEALPAT